MSDERLTDEDRSAFNEAIELATRQHNKYVATLRECDELKRKLRVALEALEPFEGLAGDYYDELSDSWVVDESVYLGDLRRAAAAAKELRK